MLIRTTKKLYRPAPRRRGKNRSKTQMGKKKGTLIPKMKIC